MNSVLGYRIIELVFTVQTHAVYSVPVEQVPLVKAELEKHGASKFRVTKDLQGLAIVCYKSRE